MPHSRIRCACAVHTPCVVLMNVDAVIHPFLSGVSAVLIFVAPYFKQHSPAPLAVTGIHKTAPEAMCTCCHSHLCTAGTVHLYKGRILHETTSTFCNKISILMGRQAWKSLLMSIFYLSLSSFH